MVKASGEKKTPTEQPVSSAGGLRSSKDIYNDVTPLQRQGRRKVSYFLAALVSLVTFLVYLPALQNEFVNWDDHVYVYENPDIRSFNLNLLRWSFIGFHHGNWHPLTWISHALDYAVWGLNPIGHHLTNNILHAMNTFLVVLLVVRLIEATSLLNSPYPPLRLRGGAEGGGVTPDTTHDSRFKLITAGGTGLLFGLHPIHVESVAWVSERKDLLCALFYLLSVMAYLKYTDRITPPSPSLTKEGVPERAGALAKRGWRSRGRYIFALFFFILALMSKPMAVTLPVVLLLLDWYPFNRIPSMKALAAVIAEKLPFIIFSIIASVVAVLAQRASGATGIVPPPFSIRTIVAAKALISYLYNMALPLNLSPFYPYPMDISIVSIEYGLPALFFIGITAAFIAMAKKRKLWLTAWGYFIITLLPVLGLVAQVGIQLMADRYTYLPSLGPFLVVASGMAWSSMRMSSATRHIPSMVILVPVTLIIFVPLCYLTVRQTDIWKNGITLWSYVIEQEPQRAPIAYVNRGTSLFNKGQLDSALADFDKAITLRPENLGIYLNPSYYAEAYYYRGEVLDRMWQPERALASFDQAIALNPKYYDAYISKGIIYGKSGSLDRALEEFNKAVKVNPDARPAHANRGYAYFLMAQYAKALEDLDKAISSNQKNPIDYVNRGKVYLRVGNKESAVSDFQIACELGNQEGCSSLAGMGR